MPLFIPTKQFALPPTPPDNENGLVGRWCVDGTGNDFSGNGNNAYQIGSFPATVGIVGMGAGNTGTTGNYLLSLANASLNITGGYTIAAWVYINTLANNGVYAHSLVGSANLELAIRSGNVFVAHNRSTTLVSWAPTVSFAAGQWAHIIVTFDGTNSVLYKNGVSAATTATLPALTSQPTYKAYLGYDPALPYSLNGTINDLRLYNRALSAAEAFSLGTQALAYPWDGEGELPAITSGTSPITGTLTVTEGNDSLSAGATVLVSGTLTVTEASDSLSANGTILVSGTLTVTEGADTLSAAGTVFTAITGTLTVTESADGLSATGTVFASSIIGTLTVTEGADQLATAAWLINPPRIVTINNPGGEWQIYDRAAERSRHS